VLGGRERGRSPTSREDPLRGLVRRTRDNQWRKDLVQGHLQRSKTHPDLQRKGGRRHRIDRLPVRRRVRRPRSGDSECSECSDVQPGRTWVELDGRLAKRHGPYPQFWDPPTTESTALAMMVALSATARRDIGPEPRWPQAPHGVGGTSGTGRSGSPTCRPPRGSPWCRQSSTSCSPSGRNGRVVA
jgi:hypothetical protein